MKKNFNVIQINGIKGLIMAGGIVACLFAGFVMFPGIVMKTVWNFISSSIGIIPQIATLQGVLLWGIVVVSYFAFRRKGLMVEFKSADDLSRDEMDEVMQRISMERQSDILTKALMNAKKMEDEAKKELKKDEHEIK